MAARKNKSRARQQDAARGAPHGSATSKWEWVSAALGLIVVLGTLGYIGYTALTTDPFVPVVTIDHIGTAETSGGYVVRFRARNSGPSTAASLNVGGRLHDGSRTIETSDVVFDYLPPHAERLGGLIFQNDPARYEIELEAKGYIEP